MSESGEKSDPSTLEWREKVCARCFQCSALLAFMEGPLCDPCLDADELRPCRDKYYAIKLGQERKQLRAVEEALREIRGEDSEPPEAAVSGVRLVARDSLAVDLCCLGKITYHRPTKSTMDTMREGFAPKSR